MHSYICQYIILLVFVHNVEPRVYVVDIPNRGAHENPNKDQNLSLQELLLLLRHPSQQEKLHDAQKPAKSLDLDKCFLLNSKTKLLECLSDMNKHDRGSVDRDSIYYPEYLNDFYVQRPKRTIYPLFDPYGKILNARESFTDLTRQKFSQDYLDVGDLSRIERCKTAGCHKRRLKNYHGQPNMKFRRFDSDNDSDNDSNSDSSDSEVDRSRKRKPSRFQVVFNDDPSSESEEREKKKPQEVPSSFESDDELEKVIRDSDEMETEKQNREPLLSDLSSESSLEQPIKIKGKYSYLQGNKIYDSFRRRLQHFLPKRIHWNNDDLHHLGYYWFDGPKGKSD